RQRSRGPATLSRLLQLGAEEFSMLRTMRESMKYLQWTLWLVVAVFVLFIFFDFGGFGPGSTGAVSRNAASVGDMGISMQDFEREYRGLEDRMRQQLGANYDPEVFGS